jgi:anti-sigma factor ChrR (cupin superfamily)
MNHPKPEEWVAYLYGQTDNALKRQLATHLHDCAQCRSEIESWQRSIKSLDAWKLPRPARADSILFPALLKWAAAAAVVLFAGIVIGRATAPKPDLEQLRMAIAPQIQRELSLQMAQMAHDEATRAASLTLVSGRRYTDQVAQQLFVALKKDVDILAFNAADALRHTQQQLVQLADFKEPQPVNPPNE